LLLAAFGDPSRRYISFEPEERPVSAAQEDWVFQGPDGKRQQAYAAHARAIKSHKQLAQVRRCLELVDHYGKDFDPLQNVASESEFAELEIARDLCARIEKAYGHRSLPESPTLSAEFAEQSAPVTASTGSGVKSPSSQQRRKRGPPTNRTDTITAAMIAEVKGGS
jgi:hypothetical protein